MSRQVKSINTNTPKSQRNNIDNKSLNLNINPRSQSIKPSPNIFDTSNKLSNSTYFERRLQEGIYSGGCNRVYTFGSNEMGQLGKEVEILSPFCYNPVLISSLSSNRIISISAGDGHTVCVSVDGVVYAWGASACCQLGINDESMPRDAEGYPYQPIPIPIKLMSGIRIKEVACGDAHTLALTDEGGAGCGQMGHPNINEMPKDADNCPYQPLPRIIEALKPLTMIHIACGKAHSLSIDSSGSLFTWGAGACGQLGVEDIHTLPVDDDGYPYQPVPKYLKSLKGQNIVLGVCGDVHTLVLNDKGEVFSFGGGSFGQLGLGSINKMPLDSDRYPYMPIPTKLESLNDIVISNIACGDSHSIAVDNEGRLYTWGAAACGQLGFNTLSLLAKDGEGNPYQPEPKLVPFFENFDVVSVSCGEAHTLVLCEGGIVFSFGGSSCGQLGYPEIKDNKQTMKSFSKSLQSRVTENASLKFEKPKLITSLLGNNVFKMACGGVHNIILTEDASSMSNNLFLMLKGEYMTDVEIVLECNSVTKLIMKCHKYVLISKSNYFYQKIYTNKNEENEKSVNKSSIINKNTTDKLIFNSNCKSIFFKTIIEYLYLGDISFLDNLEFNNNNSFLDILVEYLKLANLLELKFLQNEIEIKIKATLIKYNEVLTNVNKSVNLFGGNSNTNNNSLIKSKVDSGLEINKEEHVFDNKVINLNDCNNSNDITGNEFKGLFFLPNGSALLLLNDEIIKSVHKNSLVLNFNNAPVKNSKDSDEINNITINKKTKLKKNQQEHAHEYDYKNQQEQENEIILNDQNLFDSIILDTQIVDSEIINKSILINPLSEFSYKQLFEKLTSVEYFDIYEVLLQFNLIEDSSNKVGYEMLKYFNKPETCDIIIKAILSATSKYFEMMLSENMKENSKGEIFIPEYTAEEFLYFMLFLYSDSLCFDIDRALDLLKGADMFAVEYLKGKLENFLSARLEIENAPKIFKFASFYNYERLRKICLAFINENYKAVIETQEFEELHRESMLEIIRFCKSR